MKNMLNMKTYRIAVSLALDLDHFPTDEEAGEVIIRTLHERTRDKTLDQCLTVVEEESATSRHGRFVVISPDGLPIQPEPFQTRDEAYTALHAWCRRFVDQGYYAAADGLRIAVDQLVDRCRVEVTHLSTANEWDAKCIAAITRGKREILADMALGRVPSTVTEFGELHDYVDANEYGGLCDGDWLELDASGDVTEESMDRASQVQDALHDWLTAGRPTP